MLKTVKVLDKSTREALYSGTIIKLKLNSATALCNFLHLIFSTTPSLPILIIYLLPNELQSVKNSKHRLKYNVCTRTFSKKLDLQTTKHIGIVFVCVFNILVIPSTITTIRLLLVLVNTVLRCQFIVILGDHKYRNN